MPENRNPWEREPPPDSKGRSFGLWLWLGLIGGVGLLVWFLATQFAYQPTTDDDWAHIIRMMAVLALVSSGLIFLRRINVRETARNIAIWVGIAAVLLLGYSFRNEFATVGDRIMGELLPHQAIEVGERELRINAGAGGHFHVVAHVNGEPVRFLIDTGATDIVLNREAAQRAGYDVGSLRFTRPYRTANGIGYGAPIRLDSIAIGPFGVADMPASVNDAPMSSSLLGISFLERLRSYEVRGSVMLLRW